MSNLFQLSTSYQQVLDLIEQGMNPEDLKDTLDSIEVELNVKVDNTIGLKRSVDADVDAIDKEIKRLQGLKQQKQNFSDRLKNYLQDMLDVQGLQKFRTPTNYIYKRKNAPSVYVTNEKVIDSDYWISQAPKLNKKQIKEDIKAGITVEGAELRESESLVIK
ncbi:siphovirus Gp157 family protein [Staphylococcus chromogenes]|uniref:Siphovirus Gp157 family protein n=3 Tax=Staphylococcus chromogenes TaxID=46126 RepID=A0AAE5T067_STACR|nr:siphovirus Gp157 family protein [Staphylococcus chromogenes]MCE5093501.1 siphovirus Gp157 family protein [Staphylococcus chromogenes]MDQ7175015.1 siphovirus Gp157 family protein [Staphylococcus chromogenes]MDU0430029.1 siphovirus Gp157 family protein [Staphylococcus chromogenes]MDU0476324.1 siphovirus Gp157 family protein [Staphylococcus chromogenes]PTF39297.1 siphovirus superfamily [Staphylococcus chromogenes]